MSMCAEGVENHCWGGLLDGDHVNRPMIFGEDQVTGDIESTGIVGYRWLVENWEG